MRHRRLVAASTAVAGVVLAGLLTAAPAVAQGCCVSGPVIVYGAPPVPPVVPPTGYVLDPSDGRPPIYVVNQGPVYSGPGIIAVPTYSEGGYAYGAPYPYVHGHYGPRYGTGYRRAYRPHVRPHFRARPPLRVYGSTIGPEERPYGVPPYGAYAVRPAASAKVIRLARAAEATKPHRVAPGAVRSAPAAPRVPKAAPETPPLPHPAPARPGEEWTRR
ncbi:hypothetical protein A33M_1029 [Rhodovulum sp. PH10]|uniref:hypothetical protein n=1 Tax=Rhodovulum sp. PH10 TaxID=1187851 RepID=UPI00027C1EEF|nr:hypothetical protein [Rhodovulum sp. PH10]EJW09718.1 hypothetical protein A33M_1029 [Rhodovulum sp. PH10]